MRFLQRSDRFAQLSEPRISESSAEGITRTRFSEAGDTLIEVLLTLVVLGLASVALIIAFSTSISASAEHRRLATADIVLGSVSQEAIAGIGSQLSLFTSCQTLGYYQTTVPLTVPSSYLTLFSAQITQVQYWNANTASFTPTCVIDAPQLITVTVTGAGGPYLNSFVVDYPLSSANSTSSAGAPTQLVFSSQPSGTNSVGLPFNTQPVVVVEDAMGNPVTTDLSPVILSIKTGTNGAILSGCSGNELAGVVTFSGCSINLSGSNYTLLATDGNLSSASTSPAFTIGGSSAPYLVFTTQPVGGPSGSALATQPAVSVYLNGSIDAAWSGTVNLSASGGILSGGCATVTITNGVGNSLNCTFQGGYLYDPISKVTLPIPYTLAATASGVVPATSSTFNVSSAGAASQLVFTTQPSGVSSASPSTPFTTQPVVAIEDAFGNVVTSSNASVNLSMTGGGTLSGCSASLSNGVVTFTGCQGSAYGTQISMTASSSGLTSATSTEFNITGVPASLVFTTQPAAGISAQTLPTQPVITIYDSGGRVVTASTTSIALSVSGNGSLQHCTGLAPLNGVINVTTCTLAGTVGTPYTLTAVQGALSVTSSAMTLTGPGVATQLVFTSQPVAGASESLMTTQPIVKLEDSAGNVATTSSGTISITYSGGLGSSSCTNLTSVTGVVNVANCTFAGVVGTNYAMTASSNNVTSATSTAFTPNGPGVPTQLVLSGCSSNIIWNTTCSASAALKDQFANVETSFNAGISFAQNGGSGTVNGLGTITATNGVANVILTGNTVGLVQIVAAEGPFTSNSLSFTVNGAPQSVAFYTSGTYSTTTASGATTYSMAGTYQLFAQGAGGGTISFASTTPSVCSVNSVSGLATIVTGGTCNITADAASTNHYLDSGTTSFTLTINRAPNSILVTSTAPSSPIYGGSYSPTATATSGDVVAITSPTPSVCTISSGLVSFVGVGNCTLDFNDNGGTNYVAAVQQVQSFTVIQAAQSALTITSTSATYNGSAYTVNLTTSGGSGTGALNYVVNGGTATGCSAPGATLTATSSGTCSVTATKAADVNYTAVSSSPTTVTFTVSTQTVAFYTSNSYTTTTTNATVLYLQSGTYQTYAKGSGNGTITFASTTPSICTVTSGTGLITIVTAGTCSVTGDAAPTINYLDSGTTTFTLTISRAVQTAAFYTSNSYTTTTTSASIGYSNGATYQTYAKGSGNGTIMFASTTLSICSVNSGTGLATMVAAGTCILTADAAPTTNYLDSGTTSFTLTLLTPAGTDVQGVANPQGGTPNSGDQVTFAYNQVMSANSLLSGFTGASTVVYASFTRANGNNSTVLTICATNNCSTVVNLGTVNLGDQAGGRYISGGSTVVLNATMTMTTVSGQSVVTVTLTSSSGSISTNNSATTLLWSPSATATNPGGTGTNTAGVTQSGAPKVNF